MHSNHLSAALSIICVLGEALGLSAQQIPEQTKQQVTEHQVVGYTDTPFLPGEKWHVHDPNRPQPPVVIPSPSMPGSLPEIPPSDAQVLFDGVDLSKWRTEDGKSSGWTVRNGAMTVPARGTAGGGDIVSRGVFGDMHLHIEWRTPLEVKGQGQERGNSGILLMGRYEVQVLDSFDNPTYPDGQAGAVYGQTPPLVNVSRGPGQWQSYDIFWTAPRFRDNQLQTSAAVTVLHNGVLVQNNTHLLGATVHRQLAKYTPHDSMEPLRLQDHGDPVQYRNIWVRPLSSTQ